MKKKGIFRLILALLTLAILLSVVSCTPKDPAEPDSKPDPEPQEEPEADTNLTIGGKSIANHKILFPQGQNELALKIRSAISSAYDLTLPTTTTDPENGKVVWLRVDPQQSPASCRVYVDERALILSVHNEAFLNDVVNLFKTTLEGEKMDYSSDFSISKNFEAVPYQNVSGTKKLTGDGDKNPLFYAVGETAVFSVAAIAGDKLLSVPYFQLDIWNESTGTGETLYLDGSKGYIEYTVENFSKPGFFYLNANVCDGDKKKISSFADSADGYHFVGSIGFGTDQIRPTEIPSDFDSYWDSVVTAVDMQNSIGMKLEKLDKTQSGYVTYYWETPTANVHTDNEPNVAAGYLTVPTSANETNKIGLRITFQAHDGEIPIPDPVYKENTATLIVCAHGFDLEKAKTNMMYYAKQKDRIGNYIEKPDYVKEMIKRDLLGARFLLEYFGSSGNNYWDGKTFVVAGNSMGAMQSTAVAALTKEVTGTDVSLLDIGIPFLCDTKGGAIGRKPRTWPNKLQELGYVDPANFASKLTCKVQINAALGDKYCPASGVMALYNAAVNVEKSITFRQNASHGGGNGGGKYQLSEPSNQ
ncbi:MAG: acetylxylan esterase [Ruminococcaceae bacterium]|nr:acetylxylan esterase [Oscillospiraceae bacterium]